MQPHAIITVHLAKVKGLLADDIQYQDFPVSDPHPTGAAARHS